MDFDVGTQSGNKEKNIQTYCRDAVSTRKQCNVVSYDALSICAQELYNSIIYETSNNETYPCSGQDQSFFSSKDNNDSLQCVHLWLCPGDELS